MTDPLSDMLTQIRNALMAKKGEVLLPYSKFKHRLAELLLHQGLIEGVYNHTKGDKKYLGIKLKYVGGKPVISNLKRISSPGQRVYSKASEIPRTLSGYGITVLSTSKGLLTDQQARKQHLGGEIICQIW